MAARGAGEESEKKPCEKSHHGGVSFHVSMDEDRPRSAVPKRFRNYKRKTVTREELNQKQLEVESRRKEKEQEMLQRIHQAQDEVSKLNHNFSVLLEVDAARQQGAEGPANSSSGTAATTQLSRQQLKEKFQAVNTGYKKMVSSIASNTRCASD